MENTKKRKSSSAVSDSSVQADVDRVLKEVERAARARLKLFVGWFTFRTETPLSVIKSWEDLQLLAAVEEKVLIWTETDRIPEAQARRALVDIMVRESTLRHLLDQTRKDLNRLCPKDAVVLQRLESEGESLDMAVKLIRMRFNLPMVSPEPPSAKEVEHTVQLDVSTSPNSPQAPPPAVRSTESPFSAPRNPFANSCSLKNRQVIGPTKDLKSISAAAFDAREAEMAHHLDKLLKIPRIPLVVGPKNKRMQVLQPTAKELQEKVRTLEEKLAASDAIVASLKTQLAPLPELKKRAALQEQTITELNEKIATMHKDREAAKLEGIHEGIKLCQERCLKALSLPLTLLPSVMKTDAVRAGVRRVETSG